MASEVLRLRILKAITAWLEATDTVTFGVTQDFTTDVIPNLVGRVFRGRVIFGDKDPIPMLSILEVPIPLDQVVSPPDSSYSTGSWELLIQGFAADDKDNPTDPAHVFMAAVKKRLAQAKKERRDFRGFGFTQVTDIRIGAGVVRPPDEVSAKAYFWLNLTLDIAEDLDDPFEDNAF